MLHAYVDESGDEGISEKSSCWLMLGCMVINANDVPLCKRYLSDGVTRIWKGQKFPSHVHFNKLPHSQRKAVLTMLSRMSFDACMVAMKKTALTPASLARLKSPAMYNYVAKHLLERLSWLGRDRNEKVRVAFATRSEASWTDLESYIELLRHSTDHQIDFRYLDTMKPIPAAQNILIQAADWIASSCGCGLNADAYEDVETGYVGILWGKFWKRKGKLWSYGFKILPTDLVRAKERLLRKIDAWLEDPTII